MRTIQTITVTSPQFTEALKAEYPGRTELMGLEIEVFGNRYFNMLAEPVIRKYQLECSEVRCWFDPATKNMQVSICAD